VVPVYGLYLSLKKKIHVESRIVVPVFVLAWFSNLRQVQNLRPTRLFSSVLFLPAISFLRLSGPGPAFLFTAVARVRRPPFFSEHVARNLLHSRSRVLVLQGELARSIFCSMLRDFPRSVSFARELDGLLQFRLSFSGFWSISDRVCSSSSQSERAAQLRRLDPTPCVTARFFDSVARYFILGADISVSCLDISVSCLPISVSGLHISVSHFVFRFSAAVPFWCSVCRPSLLWLVCPS
jgi:hypothetical protein